VLALAYWIGPTERLDRTVLDALGTGTDAFVNHVAYVGFQVFNTIPVWVLAATIAALIALAQWRLSDAVFAVALVAGTGILVLALKALLINPRYQPIPLNSDAYPWEDAFPSGHAAGSLAMSLAFFTVVPLSWRRSTAVAGVAFTVVRAYGAAHAPISGSTWRVRAICPAKFVDPAAPPGPLHAPTGHALELLRSYLYQRRFPAPLRPRPQIFDLVSFPPAVPPRIGEARIPLAKAPEGCRSG
jgi:membrane-associated phospholipid phosphatase